MIAEESVRSDWILDIFFKKFSLIDCRSERMRVKFSLRNRKNRFTTYREDWGSGSGMRIMEKMTNLVVGILSVR